MAGSRQGTRGGAERWQLDAAAVREQMYRAPTPRERERWHALWLACRAGPPRRWPRRWAAIRTRWAAGWPPFAGTVPRALTFMHTGGSPPP